jgi:hypothetical protein
MRVCVLIEMLINLSSSQEYLGDRAKQSLPSRLPVPNEILRAKTPFAPGPSDFIIHWQHGGAFNNMKSTKLAVKLWGM